MPKLNILHHKSWHVYNKDNIEKVQRDEKLAREVEEAQEEKLRGQSFEGKVENLKATNESSELIGDDAVVAGIHAKAKREAISQEEKLWEHKTGIVKYLDGGEFLTQRKQVPWYLIPTCVGNISAQKEKDAGKIEQAGGKKERRKKRKIDIETLRKERLEREQEEREKLKTPAVNKDSNGGQKRYNSQFHPEYCKK
eukprot:Sdes_comp17502_c0_seq1m6734